MPIYEYICTECGHQLEALQKMSDTPLQECPACQKKSLKKQMSVVSFHLKGSGWYNSSVPEPTCSTGNCCPTGACPSVSD